MGFEWIGQVVQGVILLLVAVGVRYLTRIDGKQEIQRVITTAWQESHDKQDDGRHRENVSKMDEMEKSLLNLRESMHTLSNQLTAAGLQGYLEKKRVQKRGEQE